MDAEKLQALTDRLARGSMSAKTLLSTFRMLEESSRNSPAYSDARYAPAYYHLGQTLPVTNLLEIGFGIGIGSGCYVRGCNSVQNILAFHETGKSYYSPRVGIHNVRRYFKGNLNVYVGKLIDREFERCLKARKWELAIVNEEADYDRMMSYLDLVWEHTAKEGTIVVDYVVHNATVGKAFVEFCRRQGRPWEDVLPTRYGTGVISR